jgi:hypothetical protein
MCGTPGSSTVSSAGSGLGASGFLRLRGCAASNSPSNAFVEVVGHQAFTVGADFGAAFFFRLLAATLLPRIFVSSAAPTLLRSSVGVGHDSQRPELGQRKEDDRDCQEETKDRLKWLATEQYAEGREDYGEENAQ